MNTEQAIIVSALETFEDYIGKHLDQTNSSLQVFRGVDREMVQHYYTERANRVFLRNYVRNMVDEINKSGFAITDKEVADNKLLLETLENL